MACRGVFFALSPSERERSLSLGSENERIEFIQEDIEAKWDEPHLLQTDKAWDAIHRCLTDGTLSVAPTSNPLGKLILAGTQPLTKTDPYMVNLIDHHELPGLSAALQKVTKEWMRTDMRRYEARTIRKS